MKKSKYVLCLMGAIVNSVTMVHGGKGAEKNKKKGSSEQKCIVKHQNSVSEELNKIFEKYHKTGNVGKLFLNLQCLFNGVVENGGSNYHLKMKKHYEACSTGSSGNKYTKMWGTAQLGNIINNESDVDDDDYDRQENELFKTSYFNILEETPNSTLPDKSDDDRIAKLDYLDVQNSLERSIIGERNLTKSINDYVARYERGPQCMKYLGEIYIGLFKHYCANVGDKKTFKTPFGKCTIIRKKSTDKVGYEDKIESLCRNSKYSYEYISQQLGKLKYVDMNLCMHIIKDFLNVKWFGENKDYEKTVDYAIGGLNVKKFNQNLEGYGYDDETKENIKKALSTLCGMAMVSEPLRSCDGGHNQRAVYDAICYALDHEKLANKSVRASGLTQRKNKHLLLCARKSYRDRKRCKTSQYCIKK